MAKYFIFLALTGFAFLSCNKTEPVLAETPLSTDNIGELDGMDRGNCFSFLYPITYVLPDKSLITLENANETNKLQKWYQDNRDISERPAFQFPIHVIKDTEVVISLTNAEDLRELYMDCRASGNSPWDHCLV